MTINTDPQSVGDAPTKTISSRFPTAYTILFGLIGFVAIITWFIPPGAYDRVLNETLGKEVPVPGTYQLARAN